MSALPSLSAKDGKAGRDSQGYPCVAGIAGLGGFPTPQGYQARKASGTQGRNDTEWPMIVRLAYTFRMGRQARLLGSSGLLGC